MHDDWPSAVGRQQRMAYANFLSHYGSPQDAIKIAQPSATLPIRAESAEANAVLADALWRIGRASEAKTRFDAVLAFDPGNATALRGRSELFLHTANAAAAVLDAQKLVTVLPKDADDRLLLARAFAAAETSHGWNAHCGPHFRTFRRTIIFSPPCSRRRRAIVRQLPI